MSEENSAAALLGNRYQLLKTLGSGGMAVVYQARDLMLERYVAVKILREDYSNNDAFRERFRQEARAAANLSHPNIVTVHDFGFDQGRLFIVMEYVPGMNLKAIIKKRGMIPMDESLGLLIQACSGIGYAHRAGLIHCDIKPHNMLVTPDGRLKVTDFGIARALSSVNPDEQHDVVWGSPHYLSPEQAQGLAPSPASDVYGLGVIMYEMLTGQLPFDSDDPQELIRLHKEATPTPPRQLNPQISPALEQIMLKVLAKEPAARYRTTDQLGRILSTFYKPDDNAGLLNPLKEVGLKPATQEPVTDKFDLSKVQPQRPAAREPITESHKQVYQQPAPAPARPVIPQPRPQAMPAPLPRPDDRSSDYDLKTIVLTLLAVILVGGLVPFWLYVYLSLTNGGMP